MEDCLLACSSWITQPAFWAGSTSPRMPLSLESWAIIHQSSVMKMPHRLAYKQSDGGIFSTRFLFPDDCSLCQKLTSIAVSKAMRAFALWFSRRSEAEGGSGISLPYWTVGAYTTCTRPSLESLALWWLELELQCQPRPCQPQHA